MIALSSSSLSRLPAAIRVPGYDRLRLHPGIVHIGVGSFHSPTRRSILRGARAAGDGRPVHLLAAMDHTSRAVLAQHQVGGAPEEVSGFGRCWPTSTFTAWWSPPTHSRPIPVLPSSW